MRATFTHLIGPQKGTRVNLDSDRISVGRADDNQLCLGDTARRVSSHHAEVIRDGDQYLLRDLGSTNGTMINGRRVMVSELAPDDLIEFGAGGPLLRFGIELPEKKPASKAVRDQEAHSGSSDATIRLGATTRRDIPVPKDEISSPKNNTPLIFALVAAMLLGGIGGLVASSRLRASDPDLMSFAEIAEVNRPSVVLIRTEFELVDATGQVMTTEARTGSGFLLTENGLIVTNRHVIRDWEYNAPPPGMTGRVTRIDAILTNRTLDDAIPAEVFRLGQDTSIDVAVLRLNSAGGQTVHGIESDLGHTNPGDEVVVIGYPLGLDLLQWTRDRTADPSLSTGNVSRVGADFIQLNLRAYQGNSGGPVFNRRGEVIGILTGKFGSAQEIALCTPISAALKLVNDEMGRSDRFERD